MALAPDSLATAAAILHNAAWIILYVFVGGGPGVVFGLIIANRIWGRGQPTLAQIHREHATAAAEHNKLFDPNHPRWKKT